MTRCIAIIPARGGSKRIPKKNIKSFLGNPIIEYSINAANLSGCFTEVMVSTDNYEVKKTVETFNVNVPFLRSEENSSDFATTSDVILEVLNNYIKLGKKYDYACCIYPCAPFITSSILHETYKNLLENNASSLMPVTEFSSPIWRALKLNYGKLSRIFSQYENTRSQDLEKAYHDAGQFYWLKVDDFLKTKSILSDNTIPYILPSTRVQDIDTVSDWREAELKYKMLEQKKHN